MSTAKDFKLTRYRTVGYTSPYVPAEWIAAHGHRPRRLIPDRPAVGAAEGCCPFATSFINAAMQPGVADAVVMATTCDQMRRAAEDLAGRNKGPVFVMNIPATWQTPTALRMYMDELDRLGRFLVDLGGKSPTQGQLAEQMLRYDQARAVLRQRQPFVSGRAFAEAVEAAGGDVSDSAGSRETQSDLHGERDTAVSAVRVASEHQELRSTDQLESESTHHERDARFTEGRSYARSAGSSKSVPIAIIGGPVSRGDRVMYDLIERAGGRVVLDATETGERTLPQPFDRRRVKEDAMLELAETYFRIPDVFRRPNSPLYEYQRGRLADQVVRGVVLVRCVWCDLWHAEFARLREWKNLPSIEIDLTGDEGEIERMRTRVESLMESLR